MPLPPEADALLDALKRVGARMLKQAAVAVADQALADADEVFDKAAAAAKHYQGQVRKVRTQIPRPAPPEPVVSTHGCADCPAQAGDTHHRNCPSRYEP